MHSTWIIPKCRWPFASTTSISPRTRLIFWLHIYTHTHTHIATEKPCFSPFSSWHQLSTPQNYTASHWCHLRTDGAWTLRENETRKQHFPELALLTSKEKKGKNWKKAWMLCLSVFPENLKEPSKWRSNMTPRYMCLFILCFSSDKYLRGVRHCARLLAKHGFCLPGTHRVVGDASVQTHNLAACTVFKMHN